jgi:hypothetical protein
MIMVPPDENPLQAATDVLSCVRVQTPCPARLRFVVVELVRISEWAHAHSPTVADCHRRRSMRDAGLACRLAAELLHDAVLRPWSIIEATQTNEGGIGRRSKFPSSVVRS